MVEVTVPQNYEFCYSCFTKVYQGNIISMPTCDILPFRLSVYPSVGLLFAHYSQFAGHVKTPDTIIHVFSSVPKRRSNFHLSPNSRRKVNYFVEDLHGWSDQLKYMAIALRILCFLIGKRSVR